VLYDLAAGLLPRPRQIASFLDRLWRHKARAYLATFGGWRQSILWRTSRAAGGGKAARCSPPSLGATGRIRSGAIVARVDWGRADTFLSYGSHSYASPHKGLL